MVKTTALILTYNQEEYVLDALKSIFEQTHQPNEIFISDDGSSDNTFDAIKDYVSRGEVISSFSGEVRINRNDDNLGFIRHFNQAVASCSDGLILYNAGDDISLPNRLETIVAEFVRVDQPRFFLAHTPVQILGGRDDGKYWIPPVAQGRFPIERLANSCALHIGASQCFTKALFEEFGPIRFEDAYEDLILGFRALLTQSYHYISLPLLQYRLGGLTSWQKNTWEVKRKRYQAVLAQRSLDAMMQGRDDLCQEIMLAYRDYGFMRQRHPHSIRVYSAMRRPLPYFEYSISSHFHRFPHLIDEYDLQSLVSTGWNRFPNCDAQNSVVLLHVSKLGWDEVIRLLGDLGDTEMRVAIDCGLMPCNYSELYSKPEHCLRIINGLDSGRRIFLISSRKEYVAGLNSLFKGSVIIVPQLHDIDGPEPQQRVSDSSWPERVLLITDVEDCSLDGAVLRHLETYLIANFREDGPVITTQHAQCVEMLMRLGLRSAVDIDPLASTFTRERFQEFDLLITVGGGAAGSSSFLDYAQMRAVQEMMPFVDIGVDGATAVQSRMNLSLRRTDLYFARSIQKQVTEFLSAVSNLSGTTRLCPRLGPL